MATCTVLLLLLILSATEVQLLTSCSNKSSPHDFIPVNLLQSFPSVFSELVACLTNLSFKPGFSPLPSRVLLKCQFLKRLDSTSLYYPTIVRCLTLNTISKIIKRLFPSRVPSHKAGLTRFSKFQSADYPKRS